MSLPGVRSFVAGMVEHVRRRGLSEKTGEKYRKAVWSAINYVGQIIKRRPRVCELTAGRLQDWIDAERERGLAPATLAVKRAALVAFFDYLRWRRVLPATGDPTIDLLLPPVRRKHGRILAEADALALVARPLAEAPPGPLIPAAALRNHAIMWLLYEGGFRVAEIANLELEDCTFDSPPGFAILRVLGKGDKYRLVPVAASVKPLRAFLERRHELAASDCGRVFPNLETRGTLTPSAISALFRRYAKRLGIGANAHMFRHLCATSIRNAGGDLSAIQDLFGHADPRTTRGYAGANLKHMIDRALLFHPANRHLQPVAAAPDAGLVAQLQGLISQLQAQLAQAGAPRAA